MRQRRSRACISSVSTPTFNASSNSCRARGSWGRSSTACMTRVILSWATACPGRPEHAVTTSPCRNPMVPRSGSGGCRSSSRSREALTSFCQESAPCASLSPRARRSEVTMDSNTPRPVPPANTGSTFLNLLSDTTFKLLQLERRFDRLVRPPFDALLRDPVARLTTALINWQLTDEGQALAQEKLLPAEEEFVDSIISTFEKQMRGLWKPGGFERGGNTKTHGIMRAEFTVHENLPERFRHG